MDLINYCNFLSVVLASIKNNKAVFRPTLACRLYCFLCVLPFSHLRNTSLTVYSNLMYLVKITIV